MANLKITELDELLEAQDDDLFVVVDNSGTPTTKKIKKQNMPGGGAGPIAVNMGLYGAINGSSTPVPVFLASDGTIAVAEADVAATDEFIGFITTNAVGGVIIGNTSSGRSDTNTSHSHTVKAGTNVYLFVGVMVAAGTTPTAASSVTWNGNSLTRLQAYNAGRYCAEIWGVALGTVASDTAGTLATSGIAVSFETLTAAIDIAGVDQATPYTFKNSAQSETVASATFTQGMQVLLDFASWGNTSNGLDAKITTAWAADNNDGVRRQAGYGWVNGVQTVSIVNTFVASTDEGTAVLLVKAAAAVQVPVTIAGVLGGFTGLTRNAKYYVSNTSGVLSTTPGTATLLVGKAISTTEILIIHN